VHGYLPDKNYSTFLLDDQGLLKKNWNYNLKDYDLKSDCFLLENNREYIVVNTKAHASFEFRKPVNNASSTLTTVKGENLYCVQDQSLTCWNLASHIKMWSIRKSFLKDSISRLIISRTNDTLFFCSERFIYRYIPNLDKTDSIFLDFGSKGGIFGPLEIKESMHYLIQAVLRK